jgi:hypothetical protein
MSGRLLSLSVLALLGFYRSHPVTVQVRDAESGAPIRDARVDVRYVRYLDLLSPPDFSRKTDRSGKIKLKIVNWPKQVFTQVSADGYLEDRPQRHLVSQEFFKEGNVRPLAVSLYAKPDPQVELVIPRGFRGVLKVRLRRTDRLDQERSGQRRFAFHVPESGQLEIQANPLMQRRNPREWKAQYDDGTPIRSLGLSGCPVPEPDEIIALRWVYIDVDDGTIIAVVGNSDDHRRIYDIVCPMQSDGRDRRFRPDACERLKPGVIP